MTIIVIDEEAEEEAEALLVALLLVGTIWLVSGDFFGPDIEGVSSHGDL